MAKIGDIKLPLEGVEVISDHMKIMDVVLDSKVTDTPLALKLMGKDDAPKILVINSKLYNVIIILLWQPPKVWKSKPEQKYLAFVGSSLNELNGYFSELLYNSEDEKETLIIKDITSYLKRMIEELNRHKHIRY